MCSDQTFQNAFLMPGFAIKLVKNIKKKLTTCGPLVLDIDYRHHYHASGIKGSYNLTVTLPDHSAIEIATMPTTKNENRQDAAAFVESVHDAIELDDNVVVLSDAKFAFINDLYTCEWRLCTFHVKKNLAQHGLGKDRQLFGKIVATPSAGHADALWSQLSAKTQEYLLGRGPIKDMCFISRAMLVLASKGGRPTSSSNSITPTA